MPHQLHGLLEDNIIEKNNIGYCLIYKQLNEAVKIQKTNMR